MSQPFSTGGQIIGASASASVLPMNNSRLISFRIDWFDLLATQWTLKSLLQHHNSKGPGSSPGGSREFEGWTESARKTYLFINIRLD